MSLRCPCCQMPFGLYQDLVDHYFGTFSWKGCKYYSDLERCPWCAEKDPELARPGPFGKSFYITGTSLCWTCYNELPEYKRVWYAESWKSAKFFYGTPQAYLDFQNYLWAYKKWWTDRGNTLDSFDYCGAKDFRNMVVLDKLGYPFTLNEKAQLEADKKADRQAIIDECNAQAGEEDEESEENEEKEPPK